MICALISRTVDSLELPSRPQDQGVRSRRKRNSQEALPTSESGASFTNTANLQFQAQIQCPRLFLFVWISILGARTGTLLLLLISPINASPISAISIRTYGDCTILRYCLLSPSDMVDFRNSTASCLVPRASCWCFPTVSRNHLFVYLFCLCGASMYRACTTCNTATHPTLGDTVPHPILASQPSVVDSRLHP